MKIIHILKGCPSPSSMVGVNIGTHYLVLEQMRAGYDVEVWALGSSSKHTPQEYEYKLLLFPARKSMFWISEELKDAIDYLKTNTWVQMHSVFIPEFMIIARRLRRRKIKYGISPHGGYGSLLRNYIKKRIYIALVESRLLTNASIIHALAETEATQIRKLITPKAKIIEAPNGYILKPLEGFKPASVNTQRPVFCFCGRLDKLHKGLDLLINGFAMYKSQGGKGVLWIIGDGADRAFLESKAQTLGVSEHVVFYGALFKEEKLRILVNMDLFMHTSRWEGMPTSCIEAASLRKPLLVSKETNMGEYIVKWNSGIVLLDNDSEIIASALRDCENMYADGSLMKMGHNAGKMVENEFRWDKIAVKLAEAWKSELSAK